MKHLLSLLLLLLLVPCAHLRAEDSQVTDIDFYARKVLSDWKVPGFGLVVNKDGRQVLAKGYGVRCKGQKEKVDAQTVFHIGSASKSFTAALVASLVDESLLSWDDRIVDLLPGFTMVDTARASHLLLRDVMIHRLGYYSQAGTYFPNLGYDRPQVLGMLCRTPERYDFRESIHYNNMAFLIVEQIISRVTGKSWEENLQERIFEPLGMTTGTSGEEGFLAATNRAAQHTFTHRRDSIITGVLKGEGRALHWLTVIGPAGGICASTEDLARWAEFHLREGAAGDRQVISREQMDFLHTGQMISTQNEEKIMLYGNCWYIEQNNDYRVYYHTGTTWGHTALCVFVPGLDLSFAMLFNAETPGSCRFSLMRRIIDIYRGAPYVDHSGIELRKWLKGGSSGRSTPSGLSIAASSRVPTNLAGTYDKEEPFGQASIFWKNKQPYLKIGPKGWSHPLVHVKGNRYKVSSGGHTYPVIFSMDREGRATGFEINWGCGEELGPWTKSERR